MARGWESKSIESQIDSAQENRSRASERRLTPEETERAHERHSLELSRTRVLHDLEAAKNPRYREQLQAALHHLDQRIAAIGES
jgi:hypothetical protein